jgi:hypothetical protein
VRSSIADGPPTVGEPATHSRELGRHHPPLAEVAEHDGGVDGADGHRPDRGVDLAGPDDPGVLGMAAQAGAVAGRPGGGGIGEERDVLRQRFADPA